MRMADVIPVDKTWDKIDTESAYKVSGYSGVAWRIVGHPPKDGFDFDDEYISPNEFEPDTSRICAIMIGDDRVFIFGKDELTPLDDSAYCAECGQVGCTGDGRE